MPSPARTGDPESGSVRATRTGGRRKAAKPRAAGGLGAARRTRQERRTHSGDRARAVRRLLRLGRRDLVPRHAAPVGPARNSPGDDSPPAGASDRPRVTVPDGLSATWSARVIRAHGRSRRRPSRRGVLEGHRRRSGGCGSVASGGGSQRRRPLPSDRRAPWALGLGCRHPKGDRSRRADASAYLARPRTSVVRAPVLACSRRERFPRPTRRRGPASSDWPRRRAAPRRGRMRGPLEAAPVSPTRPRALPAAPSGPPEVTTERRPPRDAGAAVQVRAGHHVCRRQGIRRRREADSPPSLRSGDCSSSIPQVTGRRSGQGSRGETVGRPLPSRDRAARPAARLGGSLPKSARSRRRPPDRGSWRMRSIPVRGRRTPPVEPSGPSRPQRVAAHRHGRA